MWLLGRLRPQVAGRLSFSLLIVGRYEIYLSKFGLNFFFRLRGSTTQNRQIFQLCFIMLKIKLYVCRILCENFTQIGQKMKKL